MAEEGLISHPKAGPADHDSFMDIYKLGPVLGVGGFSEVRHGVCCTTGEPAAVKVIKVTGAHCCSAPQHCKCGGGSGRARAEQIRKEISILKSLNSSHVVRLVDVYRQGPLFYLVSELCAGGELLADMLSTPRGRYSETDACQALHGILRGIRYIHAKGIVHRDIKVRVLPLACNAGLAKGIVHRDIKLENVLLARKGDLSSVKIADFGLAVRKVNKARLTTMDLSGSALYIAPELIKCAEATDGVPRWYDERVDLWSTGVALYIMLSGAPPFEGPDLLAIFDKVKRANVSFAAPVWGGVSGAAKDLVKRLLQPNPDNRISLAGALAHPFLAPERSRHSAAAIAAAAAAGMRSRWSTGGSPGLLEDEDSTSSTRSSDSRMFPPAGGGSGEHSFNAPGSLGRILVRRDSLPGSRAKASGTPRSARHAGRPNNRPGGSYSGQSRPVYMRPGDSEEFAHSRPGASRSESRRSSGGSTCAGGGVGGRGDAPARQPGSADRDVGAGPFGRAERDEDEDLASLIVDVPTRPGGRRPKGHATVPVGIPRPAPSGSSPLGPRPASPPSVASIVEGLIDDDERARDVDSLGKSRSGSSRFGGSAEGSTVGSDRGASASASTSTSFDEQMSTSGATEDSEAEGSVGGGRGQGASSKLSRLGAPPVVAAGAPLEGVPEMGSWKRGGGPGWGSNELVAGVSQLQQASPTSRPSTAPPSSGKPHGSKGGLAGWIQGVGRKAMSKINRKQQGGSTKPSKHPRDIDRPASAR